MTSFEVQAGNNAEKWVNIELCQVHDEENMRNESAFEKKYSSKIEDMASEL